jgi:hypothetical protein
MINDRYNKKYLSSGHNKYRTCWLILIPIARHVTIRPFYFDGWLPFTVIMTYKTRVQFRPAPCQLVCRLYLSLSLVHQTLPRNCRWRPFVVMVTVSSDNNYKLNNYHLSGRLYVWRCIIFHFLYFCLLFSMLVMCNVLCVWYHMLTLDRRVIILLWKKNTASGHVLVVGRHAIHASIIAATVPIYKPYHICAAPYHYR